MNDDGVVNVDDLIMMIGADRSTGQKSNRVETECYTQPRVPFRHAMAKQRDYYEVLGVERSATAEQVRSAYRKLARKFHPDVNKAPDAAKRFAEVQEAYDVLSDQEKRASYDRFGHVGAGAGVHPGPGGGGSWGPRPGRGGRTTGGWSSVEPGDFDSGDFASIFEQMFGGGRGGHGAGPGRGADAESPFGFGGRGAAGPRATPQPQRGQDIEHTLAVTFLTAARGGNEQLRFTGGNGATQTISVKIPPGVETGAKLRLKGKGQPGAMGGPAGDIMLNIEVGRHPYFRREGLDVLIDLPISVTEAMLGTKVSVPLLPPAPGSGSAGGGRPSVELKVPPGSSSGQRLRVKGKGVTDASGKSGDFYAVVQIVAQSALTLSERAKEHVDGLAGELKNVRESPPWADDL